MSVKEGSGCCLGWSTAVLWKVGAEIGLGGRWQQRRVRKSMKRPEITPAPAVVMPTSVCGRTLMTTLEGTSFHEHDRRSREKDNASKVQDQDDILGGHRQQRPPAVVRAGSAGGRISAVLRP